MGNQQFCTKDTRDLKSTYVMCGKQSEFRNSTAINIVNQIPVVSGPPLNFHKHQTFRKVQKSSAEFCQKNNLDPSYQSIVSRIIAYDHKNIFKAYQKLPFNKKQQFFQEVRFIDFDFLDSLYHSYILGAKPPNKYVTDSKKIYDQNQILEAERLKYVQKGKEIIRNKEIGFLFLCAGCSSRFLFQDKFLTPLPMKSEKTLLQIMFERIRRNFGIPQNQTADVPIVIACSRQNRYTIETYLRDNKFFNFSSSKIRFLIIENTPVLDTNGKLCLTFEYKILQRPSGTAKCIQEFLNSGSYQFFKAESINHLHIIGCQNLAQSPGDPFLLGYLASNKLQILGKCTDPYFSTEMFNRYTGQGQKTCLMDVQQILKSPIPENVLQKILQKSPIAMNSIVCKLNELKYMIKDYSNSMFLSQQFHPVIRYENYFNFQSNKPEVGKKAITFEKDIGLLFRCTNKHRILKVSRDQFLPILSKNKEYNIDEAAKKLIKNHESAISFSRVKE